MCSVNVWPVATVGFCDVWDQQGESLPCAWKVEMDFFTWFFFYIILHGLYDSSREWQEVGGTEMGWEGKDVSSRDVESASLKFLQLKVCPRKDSHVMIDVETVCWTCPTNLPLYDQWLELHLYFNILMIKNMNLMNREKLLSYFVSIKTLCLT